MERTGFRFQNTYYTEFVSRLISRKSLGKLERSIEKAPVGVMTIQIADFFRLAGEFGEETGLQILEMLEEGALNLFGRFFLDCWMISVEQMKINETVLFYHLPPDAAAGLSKETAAFRIRLEADMNDNTRDLIARPITVLVGTAGVEKGLSEVFHRRLFTAFYKAHRDAVLPVEKKRRHLQDTFADLLTGDRLQCLYQPVLDFTNGGLLGWEAFIRGPETGPFHDPKMLFGYAADMGKRFELDTACVETALSHFGRVSGEKLLFVNTELLMSRDAETVRSRLTRLVLDRGMKIENVVLEFSEGAGFRDYTVLLKNMEEYREEGFRIAIDDIGAGRSTLRSVSRIRPDFIKLDLSLVHRIDHDDIKRVIAEGYVGLARKIQSEVVAVGVETGNELGVLISLGIRFGQGYHIAKPEYPKAEIEIPVPEITFSREVPQKKPRHDYDVLGEETGRLLIRSLVETPLIVDGSELVQEVKNMLLDRPPMSSVVVVDNRRIAGLVMSYKLNQKLGTRYGVSLFYHREISRLMDRAPLVVEGDTPLDVVAEMAMNRDDAKIYDDVVVSKNNEVIGIVSIRNMLDMLAKVQSEAKEAAVAATKAKSDFLANMSHEIRTPLNAVIGLTELALATELTPKQQDYLDKIHISAQSLLEIINDILDFSKIEAGKLELEKTTFNLIDILDNLTDMFSGKIARKGIELIISTAPDVPRMLIGDPLRLSQILINLINNAVKFTESGEVVVRVARPKTAENPGTLLFSVRDTGIGIKPENINKLFKSFSQADGSTTRRYGGTGLGLTICKLLVEMMNGRIGVKSRYERGSLFHFTAAFEVPEETETKRPSLPVNLKNLKVLVADDNQTTREVIHEILTGFRFLAVTVENGEEALKRLIETIPPFDLVILDWKMPGLDGIETLKRLREIPHLQDIPVIMMTAFGREDLIDTASRWGAGAFLFKPIKQSMLFDTIMEVFGKRIDTEKRGRQRDAPRTAAHVVGRRVLLVDDNAINRQVAVELLNNAGLVVDTAVNGREAVDRVRETEYAAVLMDVQMPELDGYEATRIIRNEGRKIPIIAMTAHAMQSDLDKCLECGMDETVSKPINTRRLFRILSERIPDTAAPAVREKASTKEHGDPTTPKPEHVPADASQTESPPDPDTCETDAAFESDIFDLTGCLETIGGSRAMLRNLLRDFVEGHADAAEEIASAAHEGDFKKAERLAHNLKGVAAVFSAEKLRKTALSLELSLRGRNKEEIEKSFADFSITLTETIQEARRLIGDVNSTPGPSSSVRPPAPKPDDAKPPETTCGRNISSGAR